MTTNAVSGQGAIVYRETTGGSPSTFSQIGEVKNIQGPGGQAAVLDASHLGSTFREKVMGLPDEGQITLTCNVDDADTQQDALKTDRTNRTLRGFRIDWPDGQRSDFLAYVLGYSFSAGVDQIFEASITLEISGPVHWS